MRVIWPAETPTYSICRCLVVLALSWGWNTSHWTADSNEEYIMPLDQTRSPSGDHRRVWALRPVLSAWALTIGLDLFFNAGVFMPLFDRAVSYTHLRAHETDSY